jgi:hypothetical protein
MSERSRDDRTTTYLVFLGRIFLPYVEQLGLASILSIEL